MRGEAMTIKLRFPGLTQSPGLPTPKPELSASICMPLSYQHQVYMNEQALEQCLTHIHSLASTVIPTWPEGPLMAVCASSRYDSRADKLQARRLPMTGDIQPLKKRAISGRSAFLGVESRDGEVLASAAAVATLGEELEVLLDTHALDLMGACPFVLGSCGGMSTQVDVEGGKDAEAGCTACAASTGASGHPGQHGLQGIAREMISQMKEWCR